MEKSGEILHTLRRSRPHTPLRRHGIIPLDASPTPWNLKDLNEAQGSRRAHSPAVGSAVGSTVGSTVGAAVGSTVGAAVGSTVGAAVGSTVGAAVGSTVGSTVERRRQKKVGRARQSGSPHPRDAMTRRGD